MEWQDLILTLLQMLQDFLDPRKLDRKALANLSANYAAVELYQEYCLYEVKNVLSDTLDQISAPADFPTTHDTPNHDKAFDEEDQNLADTTINAEKQSLKPVSRQDDDLNNHDPEPLAEIVPSTVQSVPDKTPEEQETLETITPTSTIVGNIGAANGKSRPITRRQIAKEKDQIASEKVHQMAALDKVEVNEKVNIVNEATIQSRSDEPELMQEKAQTMSQLPVKETQEIKSAEAVKNTDLVKDQSNGRIESTVRADSSMLAKDTAGGPHHSISEASNHNQVCRFISASFHVIQESVLMFQYDLNICWNRSWQSLDMYTYDQACSLIFASFCVSFVESHSHNGNPDSRKDAAYCSSWIANIDILRFERQLSISQFQATVSLN